MKTEIYGSARTPTNRSNRGEFYATTRGSEDRGGSLRKFAYQYSMKIRFEDHSDFRATLRNVVCSCFRLDSYQWRGDRRAEKKANVFRSTPYYLDFIRLTIRRSSFGQIRFLRPREIVFQDGCYVISTENARSRLINEV